MSNIIDNYAKSLFNLALLSNDLEKITSDLKYFANLIKESSDLRKFLYSKTINFNHKKLVLEKLAKSFQDISSKFLLILIKNNRVSLIAQIQENFQLYYRRHNNIEAVQLTIANAAEGSEIEKFKEILSKSYNKNIELEVNVDSSLIAGLVLWLKNNNTLLDLSLAKEIKSLANK